LRCLLFLFALDGVFGDGQGEIRWEGIDDAPFLRDTLLSKYLTLQRPVDPPRQPYPYRYVMAEGEDKGRVLTSAEDITRILANAGMSFDNAGMRRRLFSSLTFYLYFLEASYPHMGITILNDLSDIRGITVEEKETLAALVDGVRYTEQVTEGLVVTAGYFWTPWRGTVYRATVTYRADMVVEILSSAVANDVGVVEGVR
jgi:hypothetical protein